MNLTGNSVNGCVMSAVIGDFGVRLLKTGTPILPVHKVVISSPRKSVLRASSLSYRGARKAYEKAVQEVMTVVKKVALR
jgi:hypothetical protein